MMTVGALINNQNIKNERGFLSSLGVSFVNFAKRHFLILRWVTACMFLGRAWQCLRWDIPLTSLLWDQDLLEKHVEIWLGMTWNEYATSSVVEATIQYIVKGMGVYFILCVPLCFWVNRHRKWASTMLWLGASLVVLIAFLVFKTKWYRWVELMEFANTMAAPMILILTLYHRMSLKKVFMFVKVATALTFIGHGLYAVGYHPVPPHFQNMVMNILHLSQDNALVFLQIVGYLDFIVALLIFVPFTEKGALFYCVLWGLLTALARIVGNFYMMFPLETTDQWLHETIMRAPNGGLPLFILLILIAQKSKKKFNLAD